MASPKNLWIQPCPHHISLKNWTVRCSLTLNCIKLTITGIFRSNLNPFWIRQAESCLKGIFVKRSLIFVTFFWDIYESPWGKFFIKPSYPKHPKIIHWNKKNDINLYFHTSLWYLKRFYTFEKPNWIVKIKKLCHFVPLFRIDLTWFLTGFCQTSDLCHFHFLNNRDS